MEVIPALQTLSGLSLEGTFRSGSVQEAIGHFVFARHLAGHPTTITRWNLRWPED
jgi:hypothetical protein